MAQSPYSIGFVSNHSNKYESTVPERIRWVAEFRSWGFNFIAACLFFNADFITPKVISTFGFNNKGFNVTLPCMCSPISLMTYKYD